MLSDRPSRLGFRPGQTSRRHDRALEAEAGRLPQPALEAGHRAELAEQADLAEGNGARADRTIAQR